MDKNNAKDFLPLVQALADGKIIQVLDVTGKYIDIRGNILFSSDAGQYRIKPEPKKGWYRVALFSHTFDGVHTSTLEWDDKNSTENTFESDKQFIKWLDERVEYELLEEGV